MKTTVAAVLTLGLLALSAAPAAARPYPSGGVTPEEVAVVMRAAELPVTLETDDQGDPTIKTSYKKVNWRVYFYKCEDGRCASLQFSAGYDFEDGLTYRKINEWNFTKRFARAALDEEMDPFIRYDVDAERGFTTEAMALAIETWLLALPSFTDFIGYEPE